eukprot:TRINITY_DN6647_c0_g2_i1.p1 TRINITY_DN6647_c0_g2~~TRINITY_DN6647_c0_g2_i1.p1  ORF type:complete len:281 (-),score=53.08 TRINITY_DN6647_c0_g2_i1:884-1600(-)
MSSICLNSVFGISETFRLHESFLNLRLAIDAQKKWSKSQIAKEFLVVPGDLNPTKAQIRSISKACGLEVNEDFSNLAMFQVSVLANRVDRSVVQFSINQLGEMIFGYDLQNFCRVIESNENCREQFMQYCSQNNLDLPSILPFDYKLISRDDLPSVIQNIMKTWFTSSLTAPLDTTAESLSTAANECLPVQTQDFKVISSSGVTTQVQVYTCVTSTRSVLSSSLSLLIPRKSISLITR